jgi:hypothetical protein
MSEKSTPLVMYLIWGAIVSLGLIVGQYLSRIAVAMETMANRQL